MLNKKKYNNTSKLMVNKINIIKKYKNIKRLI